MHLECERIREINNDLLEVFRSDLEAAGLTEKTIDRHVSNVDFYINEYLLWEDALPMDDGMGGEIGMFLGYFFIRKCMWSTPASIKSNAASFKKFYKCMMEHGKVEKSDYEDMCKYIKERLPKWQADCAQYNDPDSESPFESYF